jgi:integrase
MIRILAELGLRAGELAGLQWDDVNLVDGNVRFYREKVNKVQTMKFSRRLMKLLRRYMNKFPRGKYLIWKLSPSGKPLKNAADDNGISRSAVSMAVKNEGRRFGLNKLSAHDLRHHWTTAQHRNGVDSVQLQRMGGWNSPAMLQTYIDEMDDVNDGHESPYDI